MLKITRPSFLYHGNPYTGKTVFLYWDGPRFIPQFSYKRTPSYMIASFMGPTCWPHEPCYLGYENLFRVTDPADAKAQMYILQWNFLFLEYLSCTTSSGFDIMPLRFTGIIVYAPCQWEMSLQCNVVSHWLGAYAKLSLGSCNVKNRAEFIQT